jgi:acyl-CoA thioesterase
MEYDINLVRKFFDADAFARLAQIEIDSATDECVTCHMDITSDHLNAAGMPLGGAIFTLGDFTFAIHGNLRRVEDETQGIAVGQSCTITYLKQAKGKRIICKSTCLSKGRNMSVYRMEFSDEYGTAVAEMHGNAFTKKKPLLGTI